MQDYAVKVSSDVSNFNQGMDSAVDSTKKFQDATDDAKKSIDELGKGGAKSVKDLISEMKGMEKSGRSVSNYRKQLSQLTRDIQDLTINYNSMTKEMQNSDIGREAVLRIQELTKEAANYRDAIADAQASINALASDTANWDAMKMGIQTLSGALQGVAAAGILGADSTEKLVRVIAKLKSIEAATNSVIQIGNALQKQSALMMGIARVQSAALTKARTLEAAATGKATLAMKALNLVAKANPYVLLASALVAVGAAVGGWMLATKKNNTVQAAALKIQENYTKALKEVQTEIGTTVGKFKSLENSYKLLKTEAEKQVWIKEHQKEFGELGLSIDDVNAADDTFIRNADKVIQAMKLRAEAAALMALYQEEYAKAYKKSLEIQEKEANRGGGMTGPKAWDKAGLKKGEDYINKPYTVQSSAGAMVMDNWQLTESGKKKMEEYGKEAGEAYVEGVEESLSPLIKEVEDKTKAAMQLESGLIAYQEKKNETNNKNNNKLKDETAEYTSQIDVLKKQLETLEKQKHYIQEGTEEWKSQIQAIEDVKSKIKDLEDQEKAYIASLNRKEIELVPTLDISKLKLPNKVELPQAKITPVFAEDRLNGVLEAAESAAAKINERFKLGIIDRDTAEELIKNVNDSLKAEGIHAKVKLEISEEDLSEFVQSINKTVSGIDSITDFGSGFVGSMNSIYESVSKLGDALDEAENGWERFFAIFSTGITVLSSIANMLDAVATVTELVNAAKTAGIATMGAETAAIKTNTDAKLENAGASAAAAIAGGAKSVADIPVVGWVMAIAAAGALLATLLSAMKQAKGFAGGGIFKGKAGAVGDKNLARLNNNEMVLNTQQQARLFKLLNGQGTIGDNNAPVELKVRGTDLVAVLQNYNNKRIKI